MSTSAITAELALEIKNFLDGIKKAQDSSNRFAKSGSEGAEGWASSLSALGAGIMTVAGAAIKAAAAVAGVAVAASAGLAIAIKDALDLGGQYSDLAARMDTTAGKARILAAQFEANGMNAEDTATTIDKMQKTIGNAANGMAASQRAFASLGLDADELMQGDPVESFNSIIDALRGVSSETERTALSMEIFGRAGGKLGVLMNDPKSLEDAQKLIGGQADLLDKHASDFDRAADILDQTRSKIQGFFVGVGSKIIDQIMPAIDALEALDLTGIGERFGAALSTALTYAVAIFKTFQGMSLDRLAELFGATLRAGFGEAINILFRGTAAAFSAVVAYFVEGIKNVIAVFGILTKPGFWSGMLNALIGIAQIFAAFLSKRVSQFLTAFKQANPLVSKAIGTADEALSKQGDEFAADGMKNLKSAGVDLAPTFEVLGERLKATGAAMGDAFMNTFRNAADILDTSEDRGAIAAVAGEIKTAAEALKNGAGKGDAVGPADGGGGGGGEGDNGMPRLGGRLAQAVNTIAGRSANAIIAAEAAKTSANTERTAKATEEIARKMGSGGPVTPQPKPAPAPSGKFA